MTVAEAPAPVRLAQPRRLPRLRVGVRALALSGTALALGATFWLGFARPLSFARFPEPVATERPLATVLGTDAAGAWHFIVPVVVAFLLYGVAVVVARGVRGGRWALLALGAGAAFALLFVQTNPVGAHDIYHNVFDARILWRYGDNPNAVPPIAYPDDPFYSDVLAWADFASVYGPVWYGVSGIAYAVGGDDLRANLIGHKALTAAFLLGTAALAYLTAERLRAGSGVAALVAVAWNPLLLFDTAGNGHNDIVMVFFALAALYALTARRWLWVFPLLALSVATKYGLILLGPLILVWMLRRPEIPRRTIAGSLLLGAAVGLAVYLPFFQGAATLDVVRRQSGYNTSSPSALLDAALITWWGMTPEESSQLIKLLVVPPFLLLYAWNVMRVRGDAAALVERCAWVLFLLLLVATWWFWPWYVIWVVPLAALLPDRRVAVVGLLFSATAMLMYVPYFWLLYGDGLRLQAMTTLVAFVPPAALALALWLWHTGRSAVRLHPPRLSRRPVAAEDRLAEPVTATPTSPA